MNAMNLINLKKQKRFQINFPLAISVMIAGASYGLVQVSSVHAGETKQASQAKEKIGSSSFCGSKAEQEKIEKTQAENIANFEKLKCINLKYEGENSEPIFGYNVKKTFKNVRSYTYLGTVGKESTETKDRKRFVQCIGFLVNFQASKKEESQLACTNQPKQNESIRKNKASHQEKNAAKVEGSGSDGGGGAHTTEGG